MRPQAIDLLVLFTAGSAGALLGAWGRSSVALRRLMGPDRLRREHGTVPDPWGVFLAASAVGLLISGLWLAERTFGLRIPLLFAKEGIMEGIAFVMYLAAAAMCAVAAIRNLREGQGESRRLAGCMLALLAAALFVVAMEEIAWGQVWLNFGTPAAWAARNQQGETTFHNLLTRPDLDRATLLVSCLLVVGTLAMMLLARRYRRPFLQLVSPHPALAPLAILIAYSAFRLHAEVTETLIALFFLFHAYRILRSTRPARVRRHATSERRRWHTRHG